MNAWMLMVALVTTGSADDVAETRIPPVKLEIPATWKSLDVDGSKRFSAPSGDAYFLLDVGNTAREMSGEECRDKILASMKAAKAEKLTIGGSAAASFSAVDQAPKEEEAVHTKTFIGCNGKSTWSLVFHYVGKKKARYQPLADKIAKSIRYL